MMDNIEKYRWFIDQWKNDNPMTKKQCESFAKKIKYDHFNQIVDGDIILTALREMWKENGEK